MKLELYKRAAIATDLPDLCLCKGDVVMLVDELTARDGSPGYAVEVFNAIGDTIDVHFIAASSVEPLREDEVFCVRARAKAAA
ncbi:MAG: DUF4926 domain-containing protein [Roseimicrobium sp.]